MATLTTVTVFTGEQGSCKRIVTRTGNGLAYFLMNDDGLSYSFQQIFG